MTHARRDAIQPTSHTTRKHARPAKRNPEWMRGGEEMKGEMDEENTESATQSMMNLSMAIGGGVGGLAKEGIYADILIKCYSISPSHQYNWFHLHEQHSIFPSNLE